MPETVQQQCLLVLQNQNPIAYYLGEFPGCSIPLVLYNPILINYLALFKNGENHGETVRYGNLWEFNQPCDVCCVKTGNDGLANSKCNFFQAEDLGNPGVS